MKDSAFLIHNTANFQFRLIQRTEVDLVWNVELVGQKTKFATIEMDAKGEYLLFLESLRPGLSVEWMKELSDFLELVNKEQNGISEARQAPTEA